MVDGLASWVGLPCRLQNEVSIFSRVQRQRPVRTCDDLHSSEAFSLSGHSRSDSDVPGFGDPGRKRGGQFGATSARRKRRITGNVKPFLFLPSSWRRTAIAVALSAVVVALYAPVRGFDFLAL